MVFLLYSLFMRLKILTSEMNLAYRSTMLNP